MNRIPKNRTPIIHITYDGKQEVIYIEETDQENILYCMQQLSLEDSQEENNANRR